MNRIAFGLALIAGPASADPEGYGYGHMMGWGGGGFEDFRSFPPPR